MTNSDIKKIVNKYLQDILHDGFVLSKNILHKSKDGLLYGFCFEKSSNEKNCYIWSFVQPLYVPSESIVLTFGQRLANKSWKLIDNPDLDVDMAELLRLMKDARGNFSEIDDAGKFYKHYEDNCQNLRMAEAVVYSAVYSNQENALSILDNFIEILNNENLSIGWIKEILKNVNFIKSISSDKEQLANLFEQNITDTKRVIGLV